MIKIKCENCPEKKETDYWHRVATVLMTIIGGEIGAVVGYFVIRLFCN